MDHILKEIIPDEPKHNGVPRSWFPELDKLTRPTEVYRRTIGRGVHDIWMAYPIDGGFRVDQYIESQRVTTQGPPIRFNY